MEGRCVANAIRCPQCGRAATARRFFLLRQSRATSYWSTKIKLAGVRAAARPTVGARIRLRKSLLNRYQAEIDEKFRQRAVHSRQMVMNHPLDWAPISDREDVQCGIFWDIENVKCYGHPPAVVIEAIRDFAGSRKTPTFQAYLSSVPNGFPYRLHSIYAQLGVTFIQCYGSVGKDTADKKMITDIWKFYASFQRYSPQTKLRIIVISGDRDFADVIGQMRNLGVEVGILTGAETATSGIFDDYTVGMRVLPLLGVIEARTKGHDLAALRHPANSVVYEAGVTESRKIAIQEAQTDRNPPSRAPLRPTSVEPSGQASIQVAISPSGQSSIAQPAPSSETSETKSQDVPSIEPTDSPPMSTPQPKEKEKISIDVSSPTSALKTDGEDAKQSLDASSPEVPSDNERIKVDEIPSTESGQLTTIAGDSIKEHEPIAAASSTASIIQRLTNFFARSKKTPSKEQLSLDSTKAPSSDYPDLDPQNSSPDMPDIHLPRRPQREEKRVRDLHERMTTPTTMESLRSMDDPIVVVGHPIENYNVYPQISQKPNSIPISPEIQTAQTIFKHNETPSEQPAIESSKSVSKTTENIANVPLEQPDTEPSKKGFLALLFDAFTFPMPQPAATSVEDSKSLNVESEVKPEPQAEEAKAEELEPSVPITFLSVAEATEFPHPPSRILTIPLSPSRSPFAKLIKRPLNPNTTLKSSAGLTLKATSIVSRIPPAPTLNLTQPVLIEYYADMLRNRKPDFISSTDMDTLWEGTVGLLNSEVGFEWEHEEVRKWVLHTMYNACELSEARKAERGRLKAELHTKEAVLKELEGAAEENIGWYPLTSTVGSDERKMDMGHDSRMETIRGTEMNATTQMVQSAHKVTEKLRPTHRKHPPQCADTNINSEVPSVSGGVCTATETAIPQNASQESTLTDVTIQLVSTEATDASAGESTQTEGQAINKDTSKTRSGKSVRPANSILKAGIKSPTAVIWSDLSEDISPEAKSAPIESGMEGPESSIACSEPNQMASGPYPPYPSSSIKIPLPENSRPPLSAPDDTAPDMWTSEQPRQQEQRA